MKKYAVTLLNMAKKRRERFESKAPSKEDLIFGLSLFLENGYELVELEEIGE